MSLLDVPNELSVAAFADPRTRWAAEDAAKAKVEAEKEKAQSGKTKHKGSVANMSLGGGKAQSLDDAVNAAVKSGLHFAVAAGK